MTEDSGRIHRRGSICLGLEDSENWRGGEWDEARAFRERVRMSQGTWGRSDALIRCGEGEKAGNCSKRGLGARS